MTQNTAHTGGRKQHRFAPEFSGTEDLGNGLKASFMLEAGINNDNGTGQASNTNNQASGSGAGGSALTFNRHSWVALQSPRFGGLRLGRSFTPSDRPPLLLHPFNGGWVRHTQAIAWQR